MIEVEMTQKTEGQLLSKEYGVGGPPASLEEAQSQVRTAGAVALEIRTLQRQAQGIILSYAIEIGRRLEEAKAMPFGDVWNMFCLRNNVPAGADFIADIEKYEAEVTSKR